jgi:hypothetical protein
MMNRAKGILLVLAVACLVGTAQAQAVNWTYVQGGFASFDPDRGSREDGWLVGGSVELGDVPIHLFGDFGSLDDIDIVQLGGGWHGLLGEKADLFADGSFYDVDFDDGFNIRFGVRWMVLERLELNGYLSWTELDLTDNKSASVNGIFDFSKRFGVGGGFDWGDNFSTARAFVRFNFGPRG